MPNFFKRIMNMSAGFFVAYIFAVILILGIGFFLSFLYILKEAEIARWMLACFISGGICGYILKKKFIS